MEGLDLRYLDENEFAEWDKFVDEDLDNMSLERLTLLNEKYHVNRPRKDYDHFFKKNDSD